MEVGVLQVFLILLVPLLPSMRSGWEGRRAGLGFMGQQPWLELRIVIPTLGRTPFLGHG